MLLSLQCYGLHASSWRGRELNTFQDPDTCSYNRNAKWLQPLLLGSLLNNRHHIKCYESVADSENPGDFKTFSKVPPCFSSLLAQVEKPDAWQEWPQWQGELLLSDPVCCSWLMRVLDLFVVFWEFPLWSFQDATRLENFILNTDAHVVFLAEN